MRYQDLQLRIYREDHHFTVWARFGPDTVTQPIDPALAGYAALTDQPLDQVTDAVKDGGDLFKAIVCGRVAELYQRARGRVANDSASALRIRLYFDPNARDTRCLMRVPWELMYDANDGGGRFLALDPRKSIVRTIDTSVDVTPPSSAPVRRVLVAAASPSDVPGLDIQRDCALIEASFTRIGVEPVTLMHAQRETLGRALEDGRFQIVHLMCHGAFEPGEEEGTLYLEDARGTADRVPARVFAQLFAGIPTPRLVCLAACRSGAPGYDRGAHPFGSVAAALAGLGLPAVIAMQTHIRDESAQAFAERFYDRLLHVDEPIEAALAAARKRVIVQRPDYGDWGIPLLFVRDVATPAARQPREKNTVDRRAGRQRPSQSPRARRKDGTFNDWTLDSGGGDIRVVNRIINNEPEK